MDSLHTRIAEIHSLISNPRSIISQDCLLDAINVLYTNCEKTKNRSKTVQQFIDKYKDVLKEIRKKNVNASDFDIKRFIQQGNFGDVYLVEEKYSCNTYVMKKVVREKMVNTYERDIMVQSKSPFIVNLFYSFQDLNHVYLIMEYVTGGDFVTLLENQPNGYLPENKTKFYIHELVQGVKYLHELGYAHRDLKPDNMLLSATGHLKLTDFGSATKVNHKGLINSIVPVGTPEYVAPEVLEWMEGNKGTTDGYSQSCDLWSIGVVAYELLTGNTPFNHDTLDMTYSSILACDTEESVQFPSNIDVSSDMIQLVQGLVQKIQSRMTMEDILKHPVFNIIDDEPPCIPASISNNNSNKLHKKDKRKRSPDTTAFKTDQRYTETALPLIGITYTGESATMVLDDTIIERNSSSIEESRQWKREKLNLMQQLSEYKGILEGYKKSLNDHKNMENAVLDKCKLAGEQYKNKCERYEITIVELQSVQEQLKQRIESYQTENEELSTELKQLKSSMDARETKLRKEARRSQQFTTSQVDNRIDDIVKSWKSEVKAKNDEIEDLKKQLEEEKELNAEINIKVNLEEELQDKYNEVEKELKSVKVQLTVKDSDLEIYMKQLEAMDYSLTQMHNELQNERTMMKDKDKEMKQLSSDVLLKEKRCVELSDELKLCKNEIADLKEKVQHMETANDKNLEASELNKELKALQSKFDDEKKWARESRLDAYRTEKELKSVKYNLEVAEKANETLTETNKKLEEELKVVKDKSATLETSLQDKSTELLKLQNQVQTLDTSMKELKRSKELFEKERKTMMNSVAAKERLEIEMRRYKLDIDSNKSELEKYRNDSVEYKAKVEKLTIENMALTELMNQLNSQLDRMEILVLNNGDKEKKVTDELKALKEEKSQLWHKTKTQEHNIKMLQNSLDDMKSNFAEKETKLKSADEVIAEYENKITNLEKTVTKSEDYLKDMMEYLDKLQKNNDILEKDNAQLRKERTEYITQLSNASQQNATLLKSNEGMMHRITELEHTIKSLESFYKQKELRLETTVGQLIKLCEHQRKFHEESLKKKPGLLKKVFGFDSANKEFDAKEMETLLSQERSRARDLADQLYMTKAELDTMMSRNNQRINATIVPENKENNVPSTNNAITSKASVTSTQSAVYSKQALHSIMKIAKEIVINTAVFLSERAVILGTRDGLFTLHLNELGEAKSQPHQIFGVEMVHNITFIHQKDMAIFILGSNRSIQTASLRHLVTAANLNAVSSPSLQTTPLCSGELNNVYLVSVSPCNNILAVASQGKLTIFKWKVKEFEQMCFKKVDSVITVLNVISPHSIVYATQHTFFTFDPTTSRHRAWLSTSEPVCSTKEARPIALLHISAHEFLACFNTGAIFIDDNGKSTRSDPLYWNYFPVAVVFRKPFLIVFNPNSITIIQITQDTLNRKSLNSTCSNIQPDDRVIDVSKPKFLGETLCNKNIVLMANSALQLLKPEEVFSAHSIELSETGSELSLSSIDEELKLLEAENKAKHTSL